MKDYRFIGAAAPIISITKWHDTKEGEIYYDLYLNGKVDGRYDLEGLKQRFLEVMMDV